MRVLGKKLTRVSPAPGRVLPVIVDKKWVESVRMEKSVAGMGQAVLFLTSSIFNSTDDKPIHDGFSQCLKA
jgi:hypothetical protein